MRIYSLQIHDGKDFDYVFHSENMIGLITEFNNKCHFYENDKSLHLDNIKIPMEDENGEVSGYFTFRDVNGNEVKCIAYDYDVFE